MLQDKKVVAVPVVDLLTVGIYQKMLQDKKVVAVPVVDLLTVGIY